MGEKSNPEVVDGFLEIFNVNTMALPSSSQRRFGLALLCDCGDRFGRTKPASAASSTFFYLFLLPVLSQVVLVQHFWPLGKEDLDLRFHVCDCLDFMLRMHSG